MEEEEKKKNNKCRVTNTDEDIYNTMETERSYLKGAVTILGESIAQLNCEGH